MFLNNEWNESLSANIFLLFKIKFILNVHIKPRRKEIIKINKTRNEQTAMKQESKVFKKKAMLVLHRLLPKKKIVDNKQFSLDLMRSIDITVLLKSDKEITRKL